MASTPRFYDRVQEVSTTTGTGTYTLAGAVSGFQTFAAVGNSNSCPYCAFGVDGNGNPNGDWEVGIGTYTASGTTLSRDKILASSNSNNAVSWTAGTRRIVLTSPASIAVPSLESGGRLTTESGVAVSTSDRSAQGTIYFTPYLHNRIALWDGSGWRRYVFSEVSLALSGLTSGKNYDVFLYDNAGTLTLELSAAWTNDTTRADALATQDGVYAKSGALTRRHLGTIRTTGTTTTEDSATKRFVANRENTVLRRLEKYDQTDSTYTSGTARYYANDSNNKIEFVLPTAQVGAFVIFGNIVGKFYLQAGLDWTTGFTPATQSVYNANLTATAFLIASSHFYLEVGLGYHYVALNEAGFDAAASCADAAVNAGFLL